MKASAIVTLACATAFTVTLAAQQTPKETAKPAAKPAHGQKMAIPAMTDATFIQMMTRHHQDGIKMSEAEESKGMRAEVKSLAAHIREGQEREMKEMQGVQVEAPGSPDATMEKFQQHMEQMSAKSLGRIEDATGATADEAFLEEMAMHHQMALDMGAKAKIKSPELQKIVKKMMADQKRDLQELKKLQKSK